MAAFITAAKTTHAVNQVPTDRADAPITRIRTDMVVTTTTRLLRTVAPLLAATTLATSCSSTPSTHPAPDTTSSGHQVTFEVGGHGTADISYSTGATRAYPQDTIQHTKLPWHTTVEPPTGGDALHLTILLNQAGGQATCTILIDTHPATSAPANGAYGRATCQAQLATTSAHQPDA